MLAYAAFFFAVFVTAVAVFLQAQNQELTRTENTYAQEIAYGFADNIHIAFVAGPGFVERVEVPKDILGKKYLLLVSISPDASLQETGNVYVNWESAGKNASFSAPTVTASYAPTTDGGMVTVPEESPYGGRFIIIDPSAGSALNISNNDGIIGIMKG
ncbi:MAG: hypothetical protein WCY41_00185 [Candidatus Micrarchaeia archaeon]